MLYDLIYCETQIAFFSIKTIFKLHVAYLPFHVNAFATEGNKNPLRFAICTQLFLVFEKHAGDRVITVINKTAGHPQCYNPTVAYLIPTILKHN